MSVLKATGHDLFYFLKGLGVEGEFLVRHTNCYRECLGRLSPQSGKNGQMSLSESISRMYSDNSLFESDAILNAFKWRRTPEGYEFWKEINDIWEGFFDE